MRFISTSVVGTNALSELASGKQSIPLDDLALAVDPLGLNGIEPGTFGGQVQGQDANTFAQLLDLLVVCSDPLLDLFGDVPGGVVERLSSQWLFPRVSNR